jgi:hypothetical protein
MRPIQKKCATLGEMGVIEDAMHVISAAFQDVPSGTVLWHATKRTPWEYDNEMWLPTSVTAEGALLSIKNPHDGVTIMELHMAKKVRGVPCEGEYPQEQEVILRHDLKLRKIGSGSVTLGDSEFPTVRWMVKC